MSIRYNATFFCFIVVVGEFYWHGILCYSLEFT